MKICLSFFAISAIVLALGPSLQAHPGFYQSLFGLTRDTGEMVTLEVADLDRMRSLSQTPSQPEEILDFFFSPNSRLYSVSQDGTIRVGGVWHRNFAEELPTGSDLAMGARSYSIFPHEFMIPYVTDSDQLRFVGEFTGLHANRYELEYQEGDVGFSYQPDIIAIWGTNNISFVGESFELINNWHTFYGFDRELGSIVEITGEGLITASVPFPAHPNLNLTDVIDIAHATNFWGDHILFALVQESGQTGIYRANLISGVTDYLGQTPKPLRRIIVVPEPSSLALIGLGLFALAWVVIRRCSNS